MRSVQEWIGKTDDAAIPPRVRLRIFLRYDGRCQCGCNRPIRFGERWDCDHRVALANGGQHSESNLYPLLTEHHRNKTQADVAEKARTYRVRLKHYGLRKAKGRPMPGTRASGLRKRMNGQVERRT